MLFESLLLAMSPAGVAINGGDSLGAAIIAIVLGLIGKTSPGHTARERQTPRWRAVMLAYKDGLTGALQVNKTTLWGRCEVLWARLGAWVMADTEDKNMVTLTRANMVVGLLVAAIALGTPAISSLTYVLNLRFAVESLKQSHDAVQRTVENQQKLIEKLADADIERRTQNATLSAKLDQVLGRLK